MWGVGRKTRETRELEGRLRSARAEASDELVRAVSARVAPRRRAQPWSRLAFAAAFTTLVVGAFASFGGVGYTKTGASHAYQTVRNLTLAKPVRVHSSAAAQYPGAPTTTQGVSPAQRSQTAGVAVAQAQRGTLPFTGYALLATVLVSMALIGLGLALRRRERSTS